MNQFEPILDPVVLMMVKKCIEICLTLDTIFTGRKIYPVSTVRKRGELETGKK